MPALPVTFIILCGQSASSQFEVRTVRVACESVIFLCVVWRLALYRVLHIVVCMREWSLLMKTKERKKKCVARAGHCFPISNFLHYILSYALFYSTRFHLISLHQWVRLSVVIVSVCVWLVRRALQCVKPFGVARYFTVFRRVAFASIAELARREELPDKHSVKR